ncbi:MAG: ABC transporter permease [Clostridiales bacterium]
MLNILWRNMKWRFQNPLSIIITIVQPLIWLVMYSAIAGQTIDNIETGNYTAFILPGIIVLVTFSACSSGGIINFIMKTSGSYYRVLIAPVKRSSIVLGQMFEAILLSFIEILILFLVSLFFSVNFSINAVELLLIIILIFMTAFFISSLAYAISLFLPNEVIYEMMMNAIVLPIFFLSTALFPLENLFGLLKIVVWLNPFTHIINLLRKLMFNEVLLWNEFVPVILLFLLMCCISFSFAMWRLKKETSC